MAITFSSTLSLRGASAILVLFVCCQNPNTGDALKLNKTGWLLKKNTKRKPDSRYYNDGRTQTFEILEELIGEENPSKWLQDQDYVDEKGDSLHFPGQKVEQLSFFLKDLGMLKPTVSTPAFIGGVEYKSPLLAAFAKDNLSHTSQHKNNKFDSFDWKQMSEASTTTSKYIHNEHLKDGGVAAKMKLDAVKGLWGLKWLIERTYLRKALVEHLGTSEHSFYGHIVSESKRMEKKKLSAYRGMKDDTLLGMHVILDRTGIATLLEEEEVKQEDIIAFDYLDFNKCVEGERNTVHKHLGYGEMESSDLINKDIFEDEVAPKFSLVLTAGISQDKYVDEESPFYITKAADREKAFQQKVKDALSSWDYTENGPLILYTKQTGVSKEQMAKYDTLAVATAASEAAMTAEKSEYDVAEVLPVYDLVVEEAEEPVEAEASVQAELRVEESVNRSARGKVNAVAERTLVDRVAALEQQVDELRESQNSSRVVYNRISNRSQSFPRNFSSSSRLFRKI